MHHWQFMLIMAGIIWLMASSSEDKGRWKLAGALNLMALFYLISAVVLFFVEKAR